MRSKIFYIAILTVFLASTVCFLPKNTCAVQNEVCITFVFQDKQFVYDQSKISFDSQNSDVVKSLQKRGFFEDNKQKAKIANQVISLGFDEVTATKYVLAGIDKTFDKICNQIEKQKQDSQIIFDTSKQNPFETTQHNHGLSVDKNLLCKNLLKKLKTNDVFKLKIPVTKIEAVTKENNQKNTQLKSYFSTDCKNSSQNRKDNLALALSKFDGMVILPGQVVSFNDVVGKRVEENGFKKAKVISYGKYVDGIGGGVCQASTTLYNAVLLAGLRVDEWHRHTLKSNYVEPSFDAMVNDNGADFVFSNNTKHKVFVKAKCDGQKAMVWLYGSPNQFEYKTKSVTEKTTRANEQVLVDEKGDYADKVEFDDESFCLQNPVDGVTSKGYLVATKNGKTVWQKLLRTDNYATVDKIVIKGAKNRFEDLQKSSMKTHDDTICQAEKTKF